MSDVSAQGAAPKVATRERDADVRSTETKASTKTSEFFVYVIAAAAILIAPWSWMASTRRTGGCSSPT